jgi:hypothetical protein
MIDAYTHPPRIVADVVHPIRRSTPQLLDHEVMHAHRLRIAVGAQFFPAILEISYQFLLFGIHRNDGLVFGQHPAHFFVDMLELFITVSVAGSLLRLLVGLQAVA